MMNLLLIFQNNIIHKMGKIPYTLIRKYIYLSNYSITIENQTII